MHNHIRAKFLELKFAPISQSFFLEHIDEVVETLRADFPSNELKDVKSIDVHVRTDRKDAKRFDENFPELFMLDSQGVLGFRLNNSNIMVSTSSYIEYEVLKDSFKKISDVLEAILKVTHFSTVSLRNINVFEFNENSDEFIHIRDKCQWGKHDFDQLEEAYRCTGAATRHQYFSHDYSEELSVSSFVVFPNYSYIPSEVWINWLLRGNPPVAKEGKIQLSIDLSSLSFASPPINEDSQNKTLKFSWAIISDKLDSLHSSINKVYASIIEE